MQFYVMCRLLNEGARKVEDAPCPRFTITNFQAAAVPYVLHTCMDRGSAPDSILVLVSMAVYITSR